MRQYDWKGHKTSLTKLPYQFMGCLPKKRGGMSAL
jgi:hypothetical protein